MRTLCLATRFCARRTLSFHKSLIIVKNIFYVYETLYNWNFHITMIKWFHAPLVCFSYVVKLGLTMTGLVCCSYIKRRGGWLDQFVKWKLRTSWIFSGEKNLIWFKKISRKKLLSCKLFSVKTFFINKLTLW